MSRREGERRRDGTARCGRGVWRRRALHLVSFAIARALVMAAAPAAPAPPPAIELYTGTVSHARWSPKRHRFAYGVCMALIDVDQAPARLFRGWWPARFVAQSPSPFIATMLDECSFCTPASWKPHVF